MASVNIYLNFNGNCKEAFAFYKSVFGGEFSFYGTFGEMPPQENYPTSESDKDMIMHVSLPISKETILMGSDTGSNYPDVTFGNNFSISVNTESKDEADRIFAALSEGGKVNMPMGDVFWGSYFGAFEDKFGVNWMVSFDLNPQ
ncbi:VOC family protein [Aquiflexum sp.]|uniref:VOC family protein n=1 Tax=Aquiflexum sp. TaxID=1872584 RepID=UPI003593F354